MDTLHNTTTFIPLLPHISHIVNGTLFEPAKGQIASRKGYFSWGDKQQTSGLS